jgi:hypothetical protein
MEWKKLISILIECEKKLVGKVAITIAKEMPGLKISEEGKVLEVKDGEKIFNQLYQVYRKYGFGVVTVIIKPRLKEVLEKAPELKSKIPKELL